VEKDSLDEHYELRSGRLAEIHEHRVAAEFIKLFHLHAMLRRDARAAQLLRRESADNERSRLKRAQRDPVLRVNDRKAEYGIVKK